MIFKKGEQKSNYTEILTKSGIFFIFRIGGLLFGYVFTLIVTKQYGSDVYGLIALALTVFMVLSILGKLGFDLNFTRYVSSKNYLKEDLKGLFYRISLISFGFSMLIAGTLFFFRDWVAIEVFNKPHFSDYLKWVAYSVPFWSLILIHSGFFRGLKKNTHFAFFQTFGRFFLTVLILALTVSYFRNGEFPLKVHFVVIVLLCFFSFMASLRLFGRKITLKSNIDLAAFLKDSSPMLMSSFVFILLSWIDRIIVGIYLPESDVAVYDVSAKLALLVSFNLDAINSILAPKVSELYSSGNRKVLKKVLKFAVLITSVLSLATFFFLVIFGKPLLGMFGSIYVTGMTVLIILSIGQLLNCFCGSVGIILQMTGNQRTYRLILFYGLLINILLTLLLVKPYGIIGVAIATMCSMILWNLLGVYYVRRKLYLNSIINPFEYLWPEKKR